MTKNLGGLKKLFLEEVIPGYDLDRNVQIDLSNPALNQHQYGIYDEVDRAKFGIKLIPATSVQHRRLSAQPEFSYYLPFLPLAICPDAPDVMAEYVEALQIWIDVTHWKIDHQIVPALIKRDIDTANIFGLPNEKAWEFYNFANGVIVQDTKTSAVYRILVYPQRIIEPSVSMARPAEKILANAVTVHVFAVQTVESLYWLTPDKKNPKQLVVVKQPKRDEELWRMMMVYNQSTTGMI